MHSHFFLSQTPSVACRVVGNLQRTMAEHHRPSKEMLLQPLPLDMAQVSQAASKHDSMILLYLISEPTLR